VLNGQARRANQRPRVKDLVAGCRTALMVCHAISMASRSSCRRRWRASMPSALTNLLASPLADVRWSSSRLGSYFGEPDRSFHRFHLAEEWAHPAGETADVGKDAFSPVTNDYDPWENALTGKIRKITVSLKEEASASPTTSGSAKALHPVVVQAHDTRPFIHE
jgi:hypothetical protein